MLVPAVAPPAITPAPSFPAALLARQLVSDIATSYNPYGDIDYGGYDDSCLYNYDVNGVMGCLDIINSCSAITMTDGTECFCTYGMSYLDCYFDKMSTCATYLLGTLDWREFQLSYYTDYCGTIPPSAFAEIEQPTEVPLSFATARIKTQPGRIAVPTGVKPLYQSTGALLAGGCSDTTDFTLVNAGATVYQAGFLGCNKNRPECCPWQVNDATKAAGEAAPTGGSDNTDSQDQNHVDMDFPVPADNNQAVLANCADDYYSVSGGCCPVGFWLFTTQVGGQTPCYSSATNRISAPTVTVGEDDEKTRDTAKPTSAVVNIVWSMSYPVQDGKKGLSTGAIAGIGAGAGIGGIALLALGGWFFMRKRKSKKEAGAGTGVSEKPVAGVAAAAAAVVPQQQQQGQPQPQIMTMQQQQQPVIGPDGRQYPPGTIFLPAPGPNPGPGPSDRTSFATSMSVSSPSTLLPQHTGASGGAMSELSSQSGQGQLLQQQQHSGGGGYFNNGTASPGGGGIVMMANNGHPAPIAEADEAQQQYYHVPQQQQQPGTPQSQPHPVPVPVPPGGASPQELGPGAHHQQQQQTGPIVLPQEIHSQGQYFNYQSPPVQQQQQQQQQQMVWDQAAGGYVLPQAQVQYYQGQHQRHQQPPYQGSPPPPGN